MYTSATNTKQARLRPKQLYKVVAACTPPNDDKMVQNAHVVRAPNATTKSSTFVATNCSIHCFCCAAACSYSCCHECQLLLLPSMFQLPQSNSPSLISDADKWHIKVFPLLILTGRHHIKVAPAIRQRLLGNSHL
eukprot:GHRR01023987.1.p2 GENE.GHRR01023987.1~~GHRR01023987.1.p2  ORF type:complete len:135 (-),score=27.64 GHRR01023987.1:466-870(-)